VLNTTLHRACGKLSLWDKQGTDARRPRSGRRWWPVFGLLCLVFGFLWAITLLTYLLPPATIWGNLATERSRQSGALPAHRHRPLHAEFAFARHLFCRFGCAVGLFQSLVWMAQSQGHGGGFRARARARLPQLRHGRLPAGRGLRPRLPDAPASAQHQAHDVFLRAVRSVPGFMRRSAGQAGASPLLTWKIGVDAVRENLRQRKAGRPPTRGGT
jgi:ferredoxin-type protein NapH